MFSLLYNGALHLYALYALPKMIYQTMTTGKYRHSLLQRFGRGFPRIARRVGPVIWVHGVSVGELRAVAPLVRQMKRSLVDATLIVSCTTETGYRDAHAQLPEVDQIVYLPVDLPYVVRPILKRVKPDYIVLSETDLWYNFLQQARACGAKVLVVNGKLSERSLRRYTAFPSVARRLMGCVDHFCVQSPLYAERFSAIGVKPEQCTVTGNTKLDADGAPLAPEEAQALRARLGARPQDPILVIGSTHEGEEEIFLPVCEGLRAKHPRLKIVLVPRHLERVPAVVKLFGSRELPYALWSESKEAIEQPYILFDVMGKLKECYQVASVAVVAGSFTSKVGGHNLLEPALYGVPAVFGPYVYKQKELASLALSHGCGVQATQQQLCACLERLLDSVSLRQAMGEKGAELIRTCRGATERTWQVLSTQGLKSCLAPHP